MGGNRDQREQSATDHKTITNDEHIHDEDKQALHTQRGKLAIPKRDDNPSLKALKARKGKPGKGKK
jgi:hypothetical protein